MNVNITSETVGIWRENSYLIKYGGECWIVDPGDEFKKLDDKLVAGNKLNGIINTHGHFDHIGAVQLFKEKYNIPFYIHSRDMQILRQGNLYKKLAGGTFPFKTPVIDEFLDETSLIKIKDKELKIHHTPGHTNGSVCIQIDKALISGDVFFKDAIGRVDLPGGNIIHLKKSITYLLETFEGFTVYPGHGNAFILNSAVIDTLKKLI